MIKFMNQMHSTTVSNIAPKKIKSSSVDNLFCLVFVLNLADKMHFSANLFK